MDNLEAAVEAILFCAGDSVPVARISLSLGVPESDVFLACDRLAKLYIDNDRGLRVIRTNNSYQMCSAPAYADLIVKTLEQRKMQSLSQPALETLSVVAYYQPVTRAYIEKVRGVDSSYTISVLEDKGIIEKCGKLEVPGRPALYKTTDIFLRMLGIESLGCLPELPDVSTDEGMQELREKISVLKNENAAEGSLYDM